MVVTNHWLLKSCSIKEIDNKMTSEFKLLLFLCIFIYARGNDAAQSVRNLVLIAGAQKSGTTVLSALLASQSEIHFARQKELHFFDYTKSYEKGLNYYWNKFNTSGKSGVSYLAESTPFYIASRHACQRIAESVPHAKMVILLRDPVQRAYSEYQMKLRRNQEQLQFLTVIEAHSNIVYQCLSKFPDDYSQIANCVSDEVAQQPGWPKLVNALKKSYAALQSWSAVLNSCFSLHQSNLTTSSIGSTVSTDSVHLHRDKAILTDQDKRSNDNLELNNNILDSPPIGNGFNLIIERSGLWEARFEANSCWSHAPEGIEHVKSLREAFLGEIENFKTCSSPILINISHSYQHPGRNYLYELNFNYLFG